MFGAIVDRWPNDGETWVLFLCNLRLQCFHTFPYVCRLQYDSLNSGVFMTLTDWIACEFDLHSWNSTGNVLSEWMLAVDWLVCGVCCVLRIVCYEVSTWKWSVASRRADRVLLDVTSTGG